MFIATLSTVILLAAIFWSQNIWAENTPLKINEDPEIQQKAADFIQELADKALTSLNQDGVSLAEQENHFRSILDEGFNVNYIAKYSLGRYRKKASTEDLRNYYMLLPEYLVKAYTIRLTKLNTREVHVKTVIPRGKQDMYVRTKVIDNENKKFDVDWRVRPVKEKEESIHEFKIIEVNVMGIGMVRTQKDDFAARISKSGFSGLIHHLQKIVNNNTEVAENKTMKDIE